MRHRSAFTLIELLVVITIIVALLAILLPSMNKAIAAAESAVCRSNTHQMHTAQIGFAADHFGSMFQHKSYPTATSNDPQNFWVGQMLRYTGGGDERTLLCPTASELNLGAGLAYPGFGNATRAWGYPGVWSNTWLSDFTGSYLYNGWMYNIASSQWLPTAAYAPVSRYYQNLSRVHQTADTPIFVDGAWCEGFPQSTDGTNGNLKDPYSPWLAIEMSRVTMTRHASDTVNGVMVDGAARAISMPGLWTLKWHTQFDTTTGFAP